ncbi:MAG TPA: hypothetical protein VHS33_00095 [Sphingomicrobium sp.]|nr:hypothetical protein [Sphingomicrobium sp.]
MLPLLVFLDTQRKLLDLMVETIAMQRVVRSVSLNDLHSDNRPNDKISAFPTQLM